MAVEVSSVAALVAGVCGFRVLGVRDRQQVLVTGTSLVGGDAGARVASEFRNLWHVVFLQISGVLLLAPERVETLLGRIVQRLGFTGGSSIELIRGHFVKLVANLALLKRESQRKRNLLYTGTAVKDLRDLHPFYF